MSSSLEAERIKARMAIVDEHIRCENRHDEVRGAAVEGLSREDKPTRRRHPKIIAREATLQIPTPLRTSQIWPHREACDVKGGRCPLAEVSHSIFLADLSEGIAVVADLKLTY